MTLEFDDLFSIFHNKVDAYDFLELTDEEIETFEYEWLRSACAKPYVRRLFSEFSLDEYDEVINFEMKYPVDEDIDMEFVIEVLALGIMIHWLDAKVNSLDNIYQVFGSKEEKLRDIVSRFAILGNGIVYSFEYAGTPLEPLL